MTAAFEPAQYYPCCAWDYPPLDGPITREEYEHALALADRYGLHRLDRPRRIGASARQAGLTNGTTSSRAGGVGSGP